MRKFVLAILLATPLLSDAGGPIATYNYAPLRYADPNMVLNFDIGMLGSKTNVQAGQLVRDAINYWNAVPTATINLTQGSDLPEDVAKANYQNYVFPKAGGSSNDQSITDNLTPIIFDNDGQILDDYLGVGASNSVGGYGGVVIFSTANFFPSSGFLILNGKLTLTDDQLKFIIAHEVGHLIGLDHSQAGISYTESNTSCATDLKLFYPLMYPTTCRPTASLTLHPDDIAAVSALYPDTNVTTEFGELSGTFVNASNVAIQGANIWAEDTITHSAYSVVSDYLQQGTGYFRLLLPAGTYTLRANPVNSLFAGASSVGPFTKTALANQSIPSVSFNSNYILTVTAGKATVATFTSSGSGGTFTVGNAMATGTSDSGSGSGDSDSGSGSGSGGSSSSTKSGGGMISPALLIVLLVTIFRRRSVTARRA